MNSLAKQTSPNQPRFAESRPRAADFFLFGQALPDVLETVPTCASGPEYAVNGGY
jgi:hypothetical protein